MPWGWAVDRTRLTGLIVNWCFRNRKCFTRQFRSQYRRTGREVFPILSLMQNIGDEKGEKRSDAGVVSGQPSDDWGRREYEFPTIFSLIHQRHSVPQSLQAAYLPRLYGLAVRQVQSLVMLVCR